jgi:hypothetical protein
MWDILHQNLTRGVSKKLHALLIYGVLSTNSGNNSFEDFGDGTYSVHDPTLMAKYNKNRSPRELALSGDRDV